jgi:hypothetical protein
LNKATGAPVSPENRMADEIATYGRISGQAASQTRSQARGMANTGVQSLISIAYASEPCVSRWRRCAFVQVPSSSFADCQYRLARLLHDWLSRSTQLPMVCIGFHEMTGELRWSPKHKPAKILREYTKRVRIRLTMAMRSWFPRTRAPVSM